MLILIGIAVAFVVGSVALAIGLIGRRLDDHPTCRACGFDLVGRGATAADVLGAPCSECGTPIASATDVRVGTRVRRRGALTAGMFLLTLSLLIAIPFVVVPLAGKTASKPTCLLLVEAEYGTTKLQETAADELMNRHVAGTLPAADGLRLVQLAAAVHANTNVAFTKVWREIMQDPALFAMLHATGQSEAITRGVEPFLKVREHVRSGTGVPVPMGFGMAGNERILRANEQVLGVREVRWSIVNAAGTTVQSGVITARRYQIQLADTPGSANWYTECPACDLEPGTHTIIAEIDAFLLDKGLAWGPQAGRPTDGPRVGVTRRATINVLPAGEESVEVVDDRALLDSIKPHLAIAPKGSVRQPKPAGESLISPGEVRIGLDLRWKGWDTTRDFGGVEMVWDADLLSPDTREVVPGTACRYAQQLSLNAGLQGGSVEFETKKPVPPGKYVLRLRADRSKAEKTEHIKKILGGDMEFEVELEEWPKEPK